MPVSIKRSQMRYKGANGEFVGVDAVADQITTEMIDNINEAGEAQLAAIQAKAEEARASVPDSYTALSDRVNAVEEDMSKTVDGAYVENGVAYFTRGDDVLFSITGIGGGGGGGSTNNAVLTVQNTTGWLSTAVAIGTDILLSLTWSSLEEEISTGDGVLYIINNDSIVRTTDVHQGSVSVNVKDILTAGDNRVKLRIADVYGNSRTIAFNIKCIELLITSVFDPSIVYTSQFTFPYIAHGDIEKTVYLEIDGTVVDSQTITTSGHQRTFEIQPLSHGSHLIRCYFESVINEQTIRSNVISYNILFATDEGTETILSANIASTSVSQYSSIVLDYIVYKPGMLTAPVDISLNGTVISSQVVDRTRHTYNIRMDISGSNTIVISSEGVTKTFNVTVTETDMAEAETDSLKLYLTSYGRSNNESEEGRAVWQDTNNDISATLTGFNFSSDGWVKDEEGQDVLRVGGDARITIPYRLFENDFRTKGKTIEIEFSTRSVLSYDATILSCISDNIGLLITPQTATLTSEQSSVTTRYKENEHIRLTFVCDKRSEDRLLMIYINGIPSGVVQYPSDDDFSQRNPVDISIGSSDCTIDLYTIRIYDNNLTRNQVLNNFIADTRDISKRAELYERNNVYDIYGNIIASKLPRDLPYMIVEAEQLPQYKGDKKTVSGTYVDPANPVKSFTFTGCQINVQGTSSAPYARKNYDLQFKNGFEMTQSGSHADNYALTDTIVPFNRFVTKADVASSEGANNVELVKLYCEISPFKTREMLADSRIRQGIYGFPIVMFWKNATTGATSFLGKYNFNLPKRAPGPYGYSGDMESWEFQNNTSNLMLFKTDYFDETMYTDPETGDTKERWRYDYEARFPDDSWVNYTKLQELQSFIVSTDRSAATGEDLASPVVYSNVTYTKDTAEYRLAKFKNEFGNYAEVNSFIFYYLFTEFFLMVDSRAKNLFIGFSGSDTDPSLNLAIDRKAVAEPYDMDTAIGTNNEGSLVFGFSLEDTDHLSGGANVFNGQNSVLWMNVRDAYKIEIQQMYQTLRSNGTLSYDNVEKRFEDHQAAWPEAIWIEDSWFKYIDPLIAPDTGKEPTAVYLPMMQGSKEEQRKWWLYNRFRYMDSKWNAGDALTDVIQLRGYAKADITVTPYADIYPTIKYASYIVQERGQHGVPTTLPCPIDEMTDTEIYIYSASQIAEIGDLSLLKVGFADFSKATRLQKIKVGDADSNYENLNMTELTLGTNALLKELDARNCTALGSGNQKTINLSNCPNIERVYLGGTQITSVSLPNGGILRTLQLPATITSLILRNQTALTSFSIAGTSNITTLWIENHSSVIDPATMIQGMPAGSRVRAIGISKTFASIEEADIFYNLLDTMRGLDETGANVNKAQVSGKVSLTSISEAKLNDYKTRYPNIEVEYSLLTFELIYMDYSGTEVLYREEFTIPGNGAWNGRPAREATAQYTFTFAGWSTTIGGIASDGATKNVTATRTIYAAYTSTVRSYTINFMDGSTVLKSVTLPYGSTPDFGETDPVKSGVDNPEEYVFTGWEPAIDTVVSAQDYIAQFNFTGSILRKIIKGESVKVKSPTITFVREYGLSNKRYVTEIYLPNALSAGNYAFQGCTNLKFADLPKMEALGSLAFAGCSNLTEMNLPSMVTAGNTRVFDGIKVQNISLPKLKVVTERMFTNNSYLISAYLPEATELKDEAFSYSNLTSLTIPKVTKIGSLAFHSCAQMKKYYLPSVTNISSRAFAAYTLDIYVSFSEDSEYAQNAPWGAKADSTVHYNTVFDENGEPVIE